MGPISYPLLSDFNKQISRDYDVLIESVGIALRGLFIIDPKVIDYSDLILCKIVHFRLCME